MRNVIFVTGTDTGVGKTWVTSRICRSLRQRGLDVGVMKPVQSGAVWGAVSADSYQLKHIPGLPEDETEICPFSYQRALAPSVAALAEQREPPTIEKIIHQLDLISSKHQVIFIEGAGGLAVPLNQHELMVEIPARIGSPVLLIARPGLGTINHTLLTVAYARQFNLKIAGVIFNGYRELPPTFGELWQQKVQAIADTWDDEQICLATNPCLIEMFAKIPILGRIPRIDECNEGNTNMDQWVDLDALMAFMGV